MQLSAELDLSRQNEIDGVPAVTIMALVRLCHATLQNEANVSLDQVLKSWEKLS